MILILTVNQKGLMMRVLCACEESQAVTAEFRRLGIEAYSCDLLPTSGMHPEWHIQADALEICKLDWDIVLAFPPCTHLASSGAAWFDKKRRDGSQQMGIGFFLAFTALDHIQRVCIENPIGIMSTIYCKPDQIIQPYQFGDPYRKSTCLWLKGLPKLVPTNVVEPDNLVEYDGGKKDDAWHYYTGFLPANLRRSLRSKTFPGIAKAMAEQFTKE